MNFLQKFRDFIASPSHSRTMGIVIMLVLVSAVSLTVIASQQQQQLKQRASGQECRLDTSSCETERGQCEQQCESLKQNTPKLYTCNIYSYNDRYCQEQINAVGGGTCGEENATTECQDLGNDSEGNSQGSSKTVCFEDSSCTASENNDCVTNCGQQKSICDNNVITQYNNCVANQTSSAPVPTGASETPAPTAPSAETARESSQATLEIPTASPAAPAKPAIPPQTPTPDSFASSKPSPTAHLVDKSKWWWNPMTGTWSAPTQSISPTLEWVDGPIDPFKYDIYLIGDWINTHSVDESVPGRRVSYAKPGDTSWVGVPPVTPTPTTISPTPATISNSCPLKSKGDANCDEKIDNSDYDIWLREFTKILTTALSDFNNDGVITTLDFNIWRDNSLTQP